MDHAASPVPHVQDTHPRPRERAPTALCRDLAAPAPTAIARFCARLDAAFGALAHESAPSRHPAFARELRAALAETAAAPDLLTPAQRESGAAGYRRHLLAADPAGRYAVVSLVWEPGQWSPVHGHHAWCGYAVLEGELTEIAYRWNEAACCAIDARKHARPTGAVSYVRAGREAIHRLGHAGAQTDAPAISLHVYGVAGERVATHVNDVVAVDARAHA
ncbi:cysteine dioxygenase type I family protein [Burkholderia thailandensis 34]|uniref:cysteine dioxygenase family protein n=1 Tax=Burkholderia thailandensis TaxID=57975 RepID=UPI0005D9D5FA|nr:cysteine dioxygenase family protein [Burkholderia thailandensis]AJY29730.1 cysteine dioxygenase type I family protein [Burkholderia thailandensis 34]AOJ56377.1 cysteine dioxygenase [Burkholderia thailandensis]KXF62121.1 cysteine dioxygenase [Burkholderia thailandensis]PNE76341.1 cysteine dioxygenase [Burkholderia thailandensis]